MGNSVSRTKPWKAFWVDRGTRPCHCAIWLHIPAQQVASIQRSVRRGTVVTVWKPGNFLLEPANSFLELGKPVEYGRRFEPGPVVYRRVPRNDLACLDRVRNPGLCRCNDSIANFTVPGDTHLARKRDSAADRRRSGQSDLGAENRIFADQYVVTDLDEVVDFRPTANPCLTESCPVDGGAGANLDVILDDDDAHLLDSFVVAVASARVSETIAPENDSGLQYASIANRGVFTNNASAVDERVASDRNPIVKDGMGVNLRPIANRDVITDNDIRPDVDVVSQLCGAGNERGRVDAR